MNPTQSVAQAEPQEGSPTRDPGREVEEAHFSLESFLARLQEMTVEERVRASRHTFNQRERRVWAARYPDEVQVINGAPEWIAVTLE